MSSLFEHSGESIVAYCDGGSRGNPGPAGFGVYIKDAAGSVLAELSQFLGVHTNNFAEYSALLAALEFAISKGHNSLRVVSDSELMVKQIKGQYRVNSPELRPLYEEARRRIAQLDHFQIQHVLREKNRHADRLANVAMDRGMGRPPAATPTPAPTPSAPVPGKGVMFRGLVKNGVVHVLGGELPDGTFVKVIPE
jgi:probable phosphoglycerate mutase